MRQITDNAGVTKGRYRHFDGTEFRAVGVTRYLPTGEETVVFRPVSGEQALLTQPRSVFVERVEVNGHEVPRFQLIEED